MTKCNLGDSTGDRSPQDLKRIAELQALGSLIGLAKYLRTSTDDAVRKNATTIAGLLEAADDYSKSVQEYARAIGLSDDRSTWPVGTVLPGDETP